MKKLVIIATALLFSIGFTANAQMMGQNNSQNCNQQQGMMMQNSGMMQEMMGNGMCPMCGKMMEQNMPMQKYMMLVNKLPNMDEDLSLTQAQTEKLIDLQTDFKKQQIDKMAELKKNRLKLQPLLDEAASSDKIRTQMQACSELKIDMKLAAYETAKKMKAELTDKQKTTLKDIMNNQAGMMQGGMMNKKQGGMMQNQK